MCKVHKDTRCEVTASECVGWCVGPFYYTYTAQHSNVTALLVTLPPIQHVLGLVRRCIRASFGLIMAAAEWDLCLLFDRPSEGWSMPRLSLDELYSGCQSLWQEEQEGAGRDYKIQFRAREGVDLLYKVAPRCPPSFPLRHKYTIKQALSSAVESSLSSVFLLWYPVKQKIPICLSSGAELSSRCC